VSVRAYTAYQSSGVTWLGEVPSHWTLRRLGYYLGERREKVSDRDYPALSVTKSGVVPQLDTAAKTDDGDNRKRVCIGDFVINGRSDRKGSSGLSALDGSVSLINIVLSRQEPIEMYFIGHLLRSVAFQEEFYRYGKGIVADLWSTNFSEMRNILLAVPPLAEQSAIAAFLDREIGKIDALVAEQERLIALLKEKRQAVISQAVTKGLDPNVPMKDSGVEWLGEVPAHWAMARLGRITGSKCDGPFGSGLKSEHYMDCGVRVIRLQNIRMGHFDGADAAFIDESYYRLSLSDHDVIEGDLLIAGLGDDRNVVGRCCVAPPEIEPAMVKADCFRFRLLAENALPAFVALQLTAGSPFDAGMMSSGSTRSRIPLSTMAMRAVVLPPLSEQKEIAKQLETYSCEFDTLTVEAQRAITLLRERRAALISAAVTGKIDVRDHAVTEQAAAA
jgi:type I restriction enzyme S subunit